MKEFEQLQVADSSAALGPVETRPLQDNNVDRRLHFRPVTIGELLRLELPLLLVFAAVMLISVTSSPDFVIKATGWELPQLLACPFLMATGIPCPWCGLTRSFMAMGSLDIESAFIFNPLGPAMFILFAGALVLMTASLIWRRRLSISLPRLVWQRIAYATIAITAATWILKLYIWQQVGLS